MAAMPGRVFAEAKVAPIVPFKVHISDTVLHDLTVGIKQGGQSTAWDDLGEWGRKRHDARPRRLALATLKRAYLAKKPI